jgi:hypothetical protein
MHTNDHFLLPRCTGMNCGATDSNHSPECRAEHAAAIAGGRFVKDEKRAADDAERERFEAARRTIAAKFAHATHFDIEWELWQAALSARADGGKGEAVAWLVTSKRGMIRCAWTEAPSKEQLMASEYDGDTITPLGRITAPQAECAPREAQPDSDVIEHKGQNLMQVWFECNRDVFVFYDRIMDTATQAECALREAQPVAPAKDRARSFVRDLMRDLKRESGFLMSDREQEVILNAFIKFAAPTPERADAEKDAARYREVRQRAYLWGIDNPTPEELDAQVDAILAANKEKP